MNTLKVSELVAAAEEIGQPVLKQEFDPDEDAVIACFRKMPAEQQALFKALGESLCKVRRTKPQAGSNQ